MSDLPAGERQQPIRLVVTDDLRRSRLTVFFRWLLVIPHVVWLWLWGVAACWGALGAWVIALVTGSVPPALHDFLARFVRYWVHVNAYAGLAADPFPGFLGVPGSYPVDVEIDPAAPQRRLLVAFRLILAIPALIVSGVLNYLVNVVTLLGWFYALATGRLSPGLEKILLYGLRYHAHTYGYLLLLTDRYPAL